jgi:hypothetical protein|tara:strand:+ start:259 stop:369 length:111 start_codon:yes stop_codon:yes gene_type:complete
MRTSRISLGSGYRAYDRLLSSARASPPLWEDIMPVA